jgi:hypothetical protein
VLEERIQLLLGRLAFENLVLSDRVEELQKRVVELEKAEVPNKDAD